MSKFLNNEGLLYLWGKIKTYVSGALPKKVSELENDSKFITLSDVPEGAAASNTVPKANGTASAAADNVIYMVAKKTANGDNAYDEYMLVSGKLEHIGDTQADIETLTTDGIDALIAQAQ